MKTLKTKRIFVLIWVVLSLSALAPMYVLIPGINAHSANHATSLWVMFIRLTNTFILIIMSTKLWRIVKAYTKKDRWQPYFYQELMQIGYWTIVLTLISPFLQIFINLFSMDMLKNTPIQQTVILGTLQFFMSVLIESPGMWVLSLSIFLFAELLQTANQIKAENESII